MQTAVRRQELKEKLIHAAERKMETQGLTALRARDLAQEVGCALGAIYNVFPDLDALVLEVNARTLTAIEEVISKAGHAAARGRMRDLPPAVVNLVNLATAYLDFAVAHKLRWQALFQHQMAAGKSMPDWYLAAQMRLFAHVEEPLRELQPRLTDGGRALLARSLFSAVHGIVSLGLDEKLTALPLPLLRAQTRQVVAALGQGLMSKNEP